MQWLFIGWFALEFKSIIDNHISIRTIYNNINDDDISSSLQIYTLSTNNLQDFIEYVLKVLNLDILINEIANSTNIKAYSKKLLDNTNSELSKRTSPLNNQNQNSTCTIC